MNQPFQFRCAACHSWQVMDDYACQACGCSYREGPGVGIGRRDYLSLDAQIKLAEDDAERADEPVVRGGGS